MPPELTTDAHKVFAVIYEAPVTLRDLVDTGLSREALTAACKLLEQHNLIEVASVSPKHTKYRVTRSRAATDLAVALALD